MAESAKWYVVHTYSGYENTVAASIEKAVENLTHDPDEFFENLGLVGGLSGLDFSESKWLSNTSEQKGNVQIIVTYKMKNVLFPDFDFGQYEFSQSVSTLIW